MELKIKLNNEEYTIEEAREMYNELDKIFGNNNWTDTFCTDGYGKICELKNGVIHHVNVGNKEENKACSLRTI